jgi:hypothetical protein
MVIRKQYNIGQLAEQLQTEVEKSRKYNGVVKLDILTANNILDVLNETNRREQKHQTLESALTFIEKEDGTQTNLMEEHNKKPECFGRHKKNDNWEICEECPYEMQCHMEEGKRIAKVITTEQKTEHYGCFGKYDEDDLDCLMCPCGDKCMKETYEAEGETNE